MRESRWNCLHVLGVELWLNKALDRFYNVSFICILRWNLERERHFDWVALWSQLHSQALETKYPIFG